MKTIIALTNLSESSHNAVHYAADMCKALRAELLLAHVVQMPVSFDVPLSEYEFTAVQQDANDNLAMLKEELLLRTKGEIIISTIVMTGTILHEIENICASKKPFLVIIGTERMHWAERFVFGSNTFNSVKNLHYPVLVVPQDAFFKNIERIVLASDFQDIDEVPLNVLKELVMTFDAAVDIVHVNKSPDDELKSGLAFAHLKEQLKEFNPRTHFITGYSVEQAVNDYAENNKEDLVIVISRKYNFFQSLIHKSQSRQITLNPNIPVLAVAE
jgi:nucleotide-binding universal stress UspA family protein